MRYLLVAFHRLELLRQKPTRPPIQDIVALISLGPKSHIMSDCGWRCVSTVIKRLLKRPPPFKNPPYNIQQEH